MTKSKSPAKKTAKGKVGSTADVEPRTRVTSDFPKHSLEQAIRVPRALEEANGGKSLPPLEVAVALGISPGSSDFRVLLSSAIKYGLTTGSFNSDRVKMEVLGARIVSPTSEGDLVDAKFEAAFKPQSFRQIYDHFRGKKLPEQIFFENTVNREMGVPREHSAACVAVFSENVEHLGIVKFLQSGKWLGGERAVESAPGISSDDAQKEPKAQDLDVASRAAEDFAKRMVGVSERLEEKATQIVAPNDKVFISHGRNKEIVAQLKELLAFGRFEPVVSVEKNTASIPVPEKVMKDMRECGAAVIHVMSEGEMLSSDGSKVHRLNENVLIEIGAAIALYGKKFVLLVHKGVPLPSNLQGLYRCEYAGDKLDYEATMKLLKTFSEFRSE